MDSLTLGLNFFGGHDTSLFAIFKDDVYGLSQERITRIKHDSTFPIDAIWEMLKYKDIDPNKIKNLHVGIATQKVKEITFNENAYALNYTLKKMIRGKRKSLFIKEFVAEKELLQNRGKFNMLKSFVFNKYGREYLKLKFNGKNVQLDTIIKKHLKEIFPNATLFMNYYEHHLTHAYSTYYSSNFNNTLIFTFDGEGDGYFSKLYHVENGKFKELGNSKNKFIPNMEKYSFANEGYISVGLIYSVFTHLLGFTPNADEGKVEALAAFGEYDNELYHALCSAVSVSEESLSMVLDEKVLDAIFEPSNLDKLFSTLSKEDIAAAVQKSTEKIAIEYLSVAKKRYPSDSLCLSGGVSANVIMNMNIYEKLFKNLYIIPAMGDDGVAQGAAVMMAMEKGFVDSDFRFSMMPYFGSSYSKDEVEKVLKEANLSYVDLKDESYIKAAELIVEGKIGALFHGRCEFGPRALGNRSIIADVRNQDIQKIINKDIKNRPLFQPFCPSMIIDERERLFENSYDNKHMTIAFKLKEEFKEEIPGAVHIDLTARVQFVSPEDNPNYYKMIKKVKELTGFGVIINTSFNKHGRTMVLTPKDAIVDFKDTNLDFMIMEGFLVEK